MTRTRVRGTLDAMVFSSLRRDDRRSLLVGFLSLFGIMTAHTILETARDTLFLSALPATQLPWAYLAIAVFAAIELRLLNKWVQRVEDKRRVLSASLFAGASITALFWPLVDTQATWVPMALYIWTGLLITVVVVQFWLLIASSVTVTQAKRIYAPVTAGGVLGAVFGALVAETLLRVAYPPDLLLASAAVMVLTATTAYLWKPADMVPAAAAERASRRYGLRGLLQDPYLTQLLAIVLVSTLALTFVDYLFKSVVANEIATDQLGTFFARFYLVLNSLALVVQLFVGGWLLRTLGVHRSLGVLPLLLLAGTIEAIILPLFIPILLLKIVDGSLRHSLNRSAMEVLYLPLPNAVRERAKGIIDAFGHRGGQAIASLSILGLTAVGAGTHELLWILLPLIAVWLGAVALTRRSYLELFRGHLRDGLVETRLQLEELDLNSMEALLNAINSDQDEEVLAAIDLFRRHERAHLIPAVILYHPSEEVTLRALDAFAESADAQFAPVARRILRSKDECEVRAAALRAITSVDPDRELLEDALKNGTWIVQAAALVGLLSGDFEKSPDLWEKLRDWSQNGSEILRTQLARSIRNPEAADLRHTLITLVQSPESGVKEEALKAMAAHPDEAFLPFLASFLGTGKLRPLAREALIGIGKPALDYLDRELDDRALPARVRRHIPRTISRFDPKAASKILLNHLESEEDGAVRYKILRGLGRIHSDHPSVKLDKARLDRILTASLRRTVQVLQWRVTCEEGGPPEASAGELLCSTLRQKERNAIERLFRLLNLTHRNEDLALVWRGLKSDDRRARAASRELLENSLRSDVREAVLALVDDAEPRQRLQASRQALGMSRQRTTYEQCLTAMLQDHDDVVRSIAARHIAELGLVEMVDELEQARPIKNQIVSEAIDRAIEMLRGVTATSEVPSVA